MAKFYIAPMYGENGISWDTNNFTKEELEVIQKFLDELNPRICDVTVDGLAIITDED